ncbi:MAG: glycosyltransferase family 2 protein [Terracidiphilus sp.]
MMLIAVWTVIVPTLNAEEDWPAFSRALLACAPPDQVLIVDSSSTDRTVQLARQAGFRVHSIARAEFNHGGTRQLGADLLPNSDLLVYLTQDALLDGPDALRTLLRAFEDPSVAAAFGRQLPRSGASALESHPRIFNYPSVSSLRSHQSIPELGFKTIFISNSFSAYRRSALIEVGGFPTDVIFGEDTVTAARLILCGYKIAYVAEASVFHSHSYTARDQFKRFFDVGVLHRRESWLLETFGKTGGEGKRYLLSEVSHMREHDPFRMPLSLLHTIAKFAGYKLGLHEHLLPNAIRKRVSMHHRFWGSPYAQHAHKRSNGKSRRTNFNK